MATEKPEAASKPRKIMANDIVRNVSRDSRGFETITDGRVDLIVEIENEKPIAIVRILRIRCQHPSLPAAGRSLPVDRTFGGLQAFLIDEICVVADDCPPERSNPAGRAVVAHASGRA